MLTSSSLELELGGDDSLRSPEQPQSVDSDSPVFGVHTIAAGHE